MPRDMQLADDAIADLAREVFVQTVDQLVEDYIGIINSVPDEALGYERACGEAAVRGFAAWVEATLSKEGKT